MAVSPVRLVGAIGSWIGHVIDLTQFLNFRGTTAPPLSASGQCTLYFDSTSNTYKISMNGGAYVNVSVQDIAAIWGSISGTLSNQADLQAALDSKADLPITVTVTIDTTTITSGVANRLLLESSTNKVTESANLAYDGTDFLLGSSTRARMPGQNRFRYLNASCNISNSARQIVPNATWTTLTFDTEDHDTDGMHSTASNTERITFNLAGKYLVWLNVAWFQSLTGRRITRILKNAGATQIMGFESVVGPNLNDNAYNLLFVALFSAGDYIYQQGYQTSLGDLNYGSLPDDGAQWGAYYIGE